MAIQSCTSFSFLFSLLRNQAQGNELVDVIVNKISYLVDKQDELNKELTQKNEAL